MKLLLEVQQELSVRQNNSDYPFCIVSYTEATRWYPTNKNIAHGANNVLSHLLGL